MKLRGEVVEFRFGGRGVRAPGGELLAELGEFGLLGGKAGFEGLEFAAALRLELGFRFFGVGLELVQLGDAGFGGRDVAGELGELGFGGRGVGGLLRQRGFEGFEFGFGGRGVRAPGG